MWLWESKSFQKKKWNGVRWRHWKDDRSALECSTPDLMDKAAVNLERAKNGFQIRSKLVEFYF